MLVSFQYIFVCDFSYLTLLLYFTSEAQEILKVKDRFKSKCLRDQYYLKLLFGKKMFNLLTGDLVAQFKFVYRAEPTLNCKLKVLIIYFVLYNVMYFNIVSLQQFAGF